MGSAVGPAAMVGSNGVVSLLALMSGSTMVDDEVLGEALDEGIVTNQGLVKGAAIRGKEEEYTSTARFNDWISEQTMKA